MPPLFAFEFLHSQKPLILIVLNQRSIINMLWLLLWWLVGMLGGIQLRRLAWTYAYPFEVLERCSDIFILFGCGVFGPVLFIVWLYRVFSESTGLCTRMCEFLNKTIDFEDIFLWSLTIIGFGIVVRAISELFT